MDLGKYLKRISFSGKLEPTTECLIKLHECHVMSIPFEALDIEFGKTISLDINKIYKKVVLNKRGGYCYELNQLFNHLLTEIGFESQLISARVVKDKKQWPEFDHMAIVVKLDSLWLVDIGYGDLFIKPIKIELNTVQKDRNKTYKIISLQENELLLTESLAKSNSFIPKYQFNTIPRSPADFEEQNTFKQTSAESHFVKNRICTLPIKNGRKTILNNTFKVIFNQETTEKEITSYKELQTILFKEFDIKIPHSKTNN